MNTTIFSVTRCQIFTANLLTVTNKCRTVQHFALSQKVNE